MNVVFFDKRFTEGSHLVVHKRKHTGGKPYGCNTCNKGFTIASNLIRVFLTNI